MSGRGTSRRVLRSLDHLRANTSNKFTRSLRPTYAQTPPPYVAPKDRIAFWNIVPGDTVRLRTGAVAHDEQNRPIRGEGVVTSVDRTTNRIYLRDVNEEQNLAPKNLKHTVPRLVDPEAGPEKGFSGNVTHVPRPVHYSKVMLKVPGTEQYASRIVRSKPFWDKRKNMFLWKRFAIVKANTEEALRSGEAVRKIEVPWPKMPEKRRPFGPNMADYNLVESETFVPWVPEDPVLLPAPRARSTAAGEARAEVLRAHWEVQRAMRAEQQRAATLETPAGARGYAGFEPKERVRPPPVPQAPTPAERVDAERERLALFAHDAHNQEHVEQGGQLFAASDYLDVAPLYGPAAGGDWGAPAAGATRAERASDGRRLEAPGKEDLDAMPLELLMTDDLANMRGLKWRMRRWKQAQQQRKAEAAQQAQEESELLKELDVLRL